LQWRVVTRKKSIRVSLQYRERSDRMVRSTLLSDSGEQLVERSDRMVRSILLSDSDEQLVERTIRSLRSRYCNCRPHYF